MNDFVFTGQGAVVKRPGGNWRRLNRVLLDQIDDPADYLLDDPGLIAAVNTSLTLGRPLLLTGEPGVGKTQLGFRIAYELGCGTIFYSVKSSSEAQDLFYQLDHLRRLHAAQVKPKETAGNGDETVGARRFLQFQGLGLAILRALPNDRLDALQLREHAWPEHERPNSRDWHVDYGEPQASLVLIDEIDKAPLDFCNDMLEEIRRLQFTIPELGRDAISIYRDPARPSDEEKRFRPQIVITSNSEKSLPEPFLRRCIYYRMQAPNEAALKTIVARRLKQPDGLNIALDAETEAQSLAFFHYLRANCQLEKPPSTAELLDWLLSLDRQRARFSEDPAQNRLWRDSARFCLCKRSEDENNFDGHVERWLTARKTRPATARGR